MTVGRYEVIRRLGSGGMATVWLVEHTGLGSTHALKLLVSGTEALRARMLHEGQVQASLRHPNLVAVTDILEHQGNPALVMEYVDGPDLGEWLDIINPTIAEAMGVYRGVVRGTRFAHRKGLIHRDLKPANILISEIEGGYVPKIADFGLVKSLEDAMLGGRRGTTRTGVCMGTPEYMAPEQIRDAASVDQRADLFSLGCILYQVVTRRVAFSGPDTLAIFNNVTTGRYRDPRDWVPNLPSEVVHLIGRLLRVDPNDRFQSCDELLEQLETLDMGALQRLQAEGTSSAGSAETWNSSEEESQAFLVPLPAPPVQLPTTPTIPRWAWGAAVGAGTAAAAFAVLLVWMVYANQPSPAGAQVDLSTVLVPGAELAPDAAEEPVEAPPQTPDPSSKRKKPTPVAPAKVERIPKPERPGRVKVTGDAVHVWLSQGTTRLSAGHPIPPGIWQVTVVFSGAEPISSGTIEVRAGKATKLACSSVSGRCLAQ